MSGGDNRVWWRGVQLDARSAAMMDAVCDLLPGIDIQPSHGSWSGYGPSAGTHAGAGAIDLKAVNLTPHERAELVEAMRVVGWAAWLRTPYQSDWPWHVHAIAVGSPGLAPAARDQVTDYLADRNGLASNLKDDGPRGAPVVVGRTFEEWQQQKKPEPRRRTGMITIKSDQSGAVWLLGGTVFAGITNRGDLQEIQKAMKDPGHTATVSQATFDLIKRAAG